MAIFNLALLGDPVEHSLSPEIHSRFFSLAGLKGAYSCIQTKPNDLKTTINSLIQLGFTGVNLTIPHKQAGLALALEPQNEASVEAKQIGSANTLLFRKDGSVYAENTDWQGFLGSLPKNLQAQNVAVLGAGGSARAVVVALLKLNPQSISLLIRDSASSKANAFQIRQLALEFIALNQLQTEIKIEDIAARTANKIANGKDLDLVVNTTPIGMHGMEEGKNPLKESFVDSIKNKNCYFYDLIYNPANTEFMSCAKERDFKAQNGYAMLELQAAYSFALWTGVGLGTLLKS